MMESLLTKSAKLDEIHNKISTVNSDQCKKPHAWDVLPTPRAISMDMYTCEASEDHGGLEGRDGHMLR